MPQKVQIPLYWCTGWIYSDRNIIISIGSNYLLLWQNNNINMVKTGRKSVLLFNPRSNHFKPRIPNSILQIAASIHDVWDYVIVDGNLEADPWLKIKGYLDGGTIGYFGCTVMPGPQLRQAIPYTLKIRELYPEIVTVWGGYFASNQYASVLKSNAVDYIINGMGDKAFPTLLNALQNSTDISNIKNLIYTSEEKQ
jgi:anaerobic magnesium-protoporphyrin IX monomethyl ester cyclase